MFLHYNNQLNNMLQYCSNICQLFCFLLLQVIKDYSDVSLLPGHAWLLPSSGKHAFAGNQSYNFEELQMYGGAHLAVLTEPHDTAASIHFRDMIGDRTCTIHIANNQTMDLIRDKIDLPYNVRVYRGGYLGLANTTTVHGVEIHVQGMISFIPKLILHHDGVLHLYEDSRTGKQNRANDFVFGSIRVQYGGALYMLSDPFTHKGMNLSVTVLHIEGGGRVESSDLNVQAQNVSINAKGIINLAERGYQLGHETNQGVHGRANPGLGPGSSRGASGGGHGGTGGRGEATAKVGLPYDNMYEPVEFGSSGGGVIGKAGLAKRILYLITGNF